MFKLFIDIETIPGQRSDLYERVASKIKPPANYSKAETIEKWEVESKPELIDKAWRNTALDGTWGEIICIGCAVDDGPIDVLSRDLAQSEAFLIERFVDYLQSHRSQHHGSYPIWIGHNVTWDIRFIWQRSIVNNVLLPFLIPYNAKPWDKNIFDTCHEWKGTGNSSGSLDDLCTAMGIKGKDGFDGSMVWDAIKAGEYQKVKDYCADDVIRARELYKRMFL